MPNSTFGNFYKGDIPSLTASNTDFVPVLNQNGLSGSAYLGSLSSEFGNIVTYVRNRLGSPVVAIELVPSEIGVCLQSANLKFSAIVNSFFLQSWVAQLLGLNVNYSQFDFQSKLPQANSTFLNLFANSIKNAGQYNDHVTKRRGYVITQVDQQMYDLFTVGFDAKTNLPMEQYAASVTGYGIHYVNFYYNSGAYMNRLYDPMTSQQFLNAEFGFPSYPTDTVFYILPVWQDISRGQLQATSDYTRKSAFRHNVYGGRNLELIPRPQTSTKVWFDFYVDTTPGTDTSPLGTSSFSGLSYITNTSSKVATNYGNVPIADLTYDNMNSIGRTWVREYTLALCMETLGFVRGKLGVIPIPGSDSITLNSADLLSRGQSMMATLEQQLRDDLAKMDLYEILNKEEMKAEKMLSILQKTAPFPIFRY